jgi:alkylated DNA repair dioxygenase AlkB
MQCLNLSLFADCYDDLELENSARIDDISLANVASDIVPGLCYYPNYISKAAEHDLLTAVDAAAWSTHWQRRTQHYGRSYRENAHPSLADEGSSNSYLPEWIMQVRQRLVDDQIFGKVANQMGINEYLPGQGIAGHVDYHGGEVVSISMGSGCLMDFHKLDGSKNASMWLAPRSLVALKGEARSLWTHGIARRKTDIVNGITIARARRVSVTLRCIV